MRRRVYISPYVHGFIDAIHEVSNMNELLKVIPPIDTYSITFDYLFQCGIDDFLIYQISDESKKTSLILKEKTKVIPDEKCIQGNLAIEKIFRYYLPDDYSKNKKYEDLSDIKIFLQDLLVASDNRAAIIRPTSELEDDLKKVKDLIPLELYQPIEYLIKTLKKDKVDLPYIQHSLDKNDIDRFKSVFNEKPFMDYKNSHRQLDSLNIDKALVYKDIQIKSNNLYKSLSKHINIRKSVITTLSLTSKIIDSSLGKIPGTIADHATKLFTEILERNQRVVIYDYSPLFKVFVDRLRSYIKNDNKE